MTGRTWWLRIVGALYVFLLIALTILKAPIKAEGPPGVLERAATGDATARFVVDTWFTFGIYLGMIGIGLLLASRTPGQALPLVWTVILVEAGGMVADVYKIRRGYQLAAPVTWLIIHSLIIVLGLLALRGVA